MPTGLTTDSSVDILKPKEENGMIHSKYWEKNPCQPRMPIRIILQNCRRNNVFYF